VKALLQTRLVPEVLQGRNTCLMNFTFELRSRWVCFVNMRGLQIQSPGQCNIQFQEDTEVLVSLSCLAGGALNTALQQFSGSRISQEVENWHAKLQTKCQEKSIPTLYLST